MADANHLDGYIPIPGSDQPRRTRRKRAIKWLDHCGTSPLVAAVLIVGTLCGVVAFGYNSILQLFLKLVWDVVPARLVMPVWRWAADTWQWWPEHLWGLALYIVLVATAFGFVVGASQRLLGCPGDLPETIASFHDQGCIQFSQAPSMFVCSLFSVCAGGSLGPEAPLLCLCASAVAYVFQRLLPVGQRMLRYCSLLGMAAGLAAFFGVSMGGALFALEVPHRMGLEYFEVVSHALAAGVLCLAVFRGLGLQAFGQIWVWPEVLAEVDARHVAVGALVGLAAGGVAIAWTYGTKLAKRWLTAVGLDEHAAPVRCGALGGFVIGALGAVLPPTMFWGEFEMKALADPSVPLPHVWPGGGVWGTRSYLQGEWGAGTYALVGAAKLVAISVTLLAGFRGGFIFPLFACGTALATAAQLLLQRWLPAADFPAVLFAMAGAAGLNTAITRTPLGSTLILASLSGEPGVAVPSLAAALVALYVTKRVPFIMSQRSRSDVRTVLSSSSKDPGDADDLKHVSETLAVRLHTQDCTPLDGQHDTPPHV